MTSAELFSWIYCLLIAALVVLIVREALYLYYNHPRRYGKNGVWPASGRYVPNVEASGGMDPAGGMRPAAGPAAPLSEREIGWWNGEIDQSVHSLGGNVYDSRASEIPSPVATEIGWWGNSFLDGNGGSE